jgi:Uma2 family endonuclease
MTAAEYLAIERKAEIKSEYIAGRMYAMSGVSRRHNLIAGNLYGEIREQLRGRPCEAYIADVRVKASTCSWRRTRSGPSTTGAKERSGS